MRAARDFRDRTERLVDRLSAMRGKAVAKRPVIAASDGTSVDVKLRVLRGRHQGAEAELSPGRISVGSSLDGDIVLTDPGIAGEHLILDLVGKPGARALTISALAPGVIVAGQELAVGAPKTFPMPTTIDVSDVGLEFVDPVPREGSSKMQRPLVVVPVAIAAGLGFPALAAWLLTPSEPNFLPSSMPRPPLIAAGPAAPLLGAAPLAEAARIMEHQLAAAGLDKQIKISQRDNVLVADGTLAIDAHPKWREIKAAVRRGVSERLLIADMVKPLETGDNGMRAMIAAVIGGKSPTVIATNGKRAGIGEALIDGWVVKQIQGDTVQLERGGSRVMVKLTP